MGIQQMIRMCFIPRSLDKTFKPNTMKSRIIILFILIFLSPSLWGQEDYCKEKLNEVREEFDRGRPYKVYELLVDSTGYIRKECEACLNNNIEGFSEIDQYELYEKLILSVIYMGFEDVSPYMKDFLSEHPLYIPKYKESALRNLYKQFDTNPIFIFGLSLGLGNSPVYPLQRYSLADANQNNKGLYSAPFSKTRIALKLSVPIHSSFELGFDPAYFSLGYKYEENLVHSNDIPSIPSDAQNPNSSFTTSILSFQENQSWIGLPLYIRYRFGAEKRKKEYTQIEWDRKKKEKIRFNLFAGVEPDFLVSASFKNMVRTLSDNPNQSVQAENINLLFDSEEGSPQLRNRTNVSLFLGAGISKNIKMWRIGMDFRMGWMLSNQVKIANRYANSNLLYLYGHVDNDFRMSDINISIYFQRRVFKPRRIDKRKRGLNEETGILSNAENEGKKQKKKDTAETKKEIADEVEKISENEKLMEEIEKKMNELEDLKDKVATLEKKLKGMDEGSDRNELENMLKVLRENIEALENKIENKNNE